MIVQKKNSKEENFSLQNTHDNHTLLSPDSCVWRLLFRTFNNKKTDIFPLFGFGFAIFFDSRCILIFFLSLLLLLLFYLILFFVHFIFIFDPLSLLIRCSAFGFLYSQCLICATYMCLSGTLRTFIYMMICTHNNTMYGMTGCTRNLTGSH